MCGLGRVIHSDGRCKEKSIVALVSLYKNPQRFTTSNRYSIAAAAAAVVVVHGNYAAVAAATHDLFVVAPTPDVAETRGDAYSCPQHIYHDFRHTLAQYWPQLGRGRFSATRPKAPIPIMPIMAMTRPERWVEDSP